MKNIPVVIMAGGYGTRMSTEPDRIPKPLVKVGEYPILWHILKVYYHQNFNKFIICAGYKQELIKKFFIDYAINQAKYINIGKHSYTAYEKDVENWDTYVVDTGLKTMTGGRLLNIKDQKFFKKYDTFCMTYGDSIGNIDIQELLKFHKAHGKIATVTAVRPPEKYGILDIKDDIVNTFEEKPEDGNRWINGGFFILNKNVFDYIEKDTMFEQDPLRNLVKDNQLMAYHHTGFWQAMDTLKEQKDLETLWNGGDCPWKMW
jgi:glucose-1-phosphate cytidylyltransferase